MRGLNPPDDIRHRMLKWNRERQLWEPRKLAEERELPRFLEGTDAYTGKSGASNRILRGVPLRALASDKKTRDIRETEYGHKGPSLPLIFEACGEDQYAYNTATASRRMARSRILLLKRCLTSGMNALAHPGDESARLATW